MEVDHSRGQMFKPNNNFRQVNSAQPERKIICWNCGQEGHITETVVIKNSEIDRQWVMVDLGVP